MIREMGIETLDSTKEMGREVVRGFTGEKPKDWADEWLKGDRRDKPPLSDKEGGHTKLDTQKIFGQEDAKKEAALRQRLQSAMHAQHTQGTARQENEPPAYTREWQEREERREQKQKAAAVSPGPALSFARKKGDWMRGLKRKKSSPQQLNRSEFVGSKSRE